MDFIKKSIYYSGHVSIHLSLVFEQSCFISLIQSSIEFMTMSSLNPNVFPAPVNHPPQCLIGSIHAAAGPELRDIINYSTGYLTDELRQDLYKNTPTNLNQPIQEVELWIKRLKVIKSGLSSFPIPVTGFATTTPAHSLVIPPSTYQGYLGRKNTLAPEAHPSLLAITACLERDQHQCIITGRRSTDGFSLEVIHIFPFSLASHQCCRRLDFWKMLEMFYGPKATDNIFGGLLDRIDSLQNLITVDSSIRAMLDSGKLTLTPGSSTHNQIPVINDHKGAYWLSIGYPLNGPMGTPDFIYSSKGLPTGRNRRLYHQSTVDMAYHRTIQGHTSTSPLATYFALRSRLLSLKLICEYNSSQADEPSPTGATLISSPVTPLDIGSGYQTYPSAYNSSCSPDPVLAAIAILQDLVDSGDLAGLS